MEGVRALICDHITGFLIVFALAVLLMSSWHRCDSERSARKAWPVKRLLRDGMREELIALYQRAGDDIAVSKRQQWAVSAYALGIHAGLFTVMKGSNCAVDFLVLCPLMAVAASLAAVHMVFRLRKDIYNARDKMIGARFLFSDAFREADNFDKKEVGKYRKKDGFIIIIMVVTIALGAVVVSVGACVSPSLCVPVAAH